MLDLTALEIKYLEVKMLDGNVINIKKPTQKMINFLVKMQGLEAEKQVEALDELVTMIVNNNKEGVAYIKKDISAYEMEIKEAIITTFAKFSKEIMANPN
ncbi:MAG: hypothetical protein ACRCX8_10300 [Sarcina sp.]